MPRLPRFASFCLLPLLLICLQFAGTANAQNTDANSAQQWADWNHYVIIARPDLAKAAGEQLLQLEDGALLDIVEGSDYANRYQDILTRGRKTEAVAEVATKLAEKIQQARVGRARDTKRIAADIELLGGTAREYVNAVARLRAAGQFAVPQLLKTLNDEKQTRLHPYVLRALIEIGRPVVYPLSVALPHLEARPLSQVAQVLAEVGYPMALPYLRQVIDNEKTDPAAKLVVVAAYNRLAEVAKLQGGLSAAELYLNLGRNYYTTATTGQELPGFDSQNNKGIVWNHVGEAGLVATPVPGEIFGDVLAMRAGQQALALQPDLDPALSLWLAANLRRVHRLPAGQDDLSYPQDFRAPAYYLMMAGPQRQHEVLDRALQDRDAALALDAIAGLRGTAGTEALINRQGSIQPLLRALYFPDRQVRVNAALALANARPKEKFEGSDRIVRALSEAVRPAESQYALVIAPDQDSLNALSTSVKELGFSPIAGMTLAAANDQISAAPGIDAVIVRGSGQAFADIYDQINRDDRLAALPVVAIVSQGDQIELTTRYENAARRPTLIVNAATGDIQTGINQASKSASSVNMTAEQATDLALKALNALRDVSLAGGEVFNAADAQPALVRALSDSRPEVVTKSAQVLALLASPEAQQAVAEVALDAAKPQELRIALLDSLAVSATNFGKHVTDAQADKLMSLVKTSQGDLGLAAARAYGAMAMPTAQAVELLVK